MYSFLSQTVNINVFIVVFIKGNEPISVDIKTVIIDVGNVAANVDVVLSWPVGNTIVQTNARTPRLAMSIRLIKHTVGQSGCMVANPNSYSHPLYTLLEMTYYFTYKFVTRTSLSRLSFPSIMNIIFINSKYIYCYFFLIINDIT